MKRRTARKERIQPREESFALNTIKPITQNQAVAFKHFEDGQHLLLHGLPGTGKTLIALYLALRELERGNTDKIVLVRSAVPTRSQGFLPGSLKEKAAVYETPFISLCTELYSRGDAYGILKGKNLLEFITSSYVRGITLSDCIMIVDEVQNYTLPEFSSVISRVGENSRVICCGDYRQTDLVREHDPTGVHEILRILQNMPSFTSIEFDVEDIVRSGLVKEWIITKDRLRL